MSDNVDLSLLNQFENTLDDMLPEPVFVPIREFVEEVIGKKPDGSPRVRRKLTQRVAEINTYVPMSVFQKMMKAQEIVRKIQAKSQENMDEAGQEAMMRWMTEQCLAVWKLTEPDMEIDTLMNGIDLPRMMWLFQRFFGSQLAALKGQAQL